MEPWQHLIPRVLTVRHLVSPIIELDCKREEMARSVFDRAERFLADQQASPEHRVPTRATVVLQPVREIPEFVILDLGLQDRVFREFLVEDSTPIYALATRAVPSAIVDSSTNFVVALRRLVELNRDADEALKDQMCDERYNLLVQEQGRFLGGLHERGLPGVLPVRFGVLALLLELEEAIIDRVISDGTDFWDLLPPVRRKKMIELARAKHPHIENLCCGTAEKQWKEHLNNSRDVFSSSTFIDKLTVLTRLGYCKHGLPTKSVEKRNVRLEALRNRCAHAGGGTLGEPRFLLELIETCQEMTLEMNLPGRKAK